MVRKAGKLPGDVEEFAYDLEYGSAILEVQTGMIKPGQKVAIIDDVFRNWRNCKCHHKNDRKCRSYCFKNYLFN